MQVDVSVSEDRAHSLGAEIRRGQAPSVGDGASAARPDERSAMVRKASHATRASSMLTRLGRRTRRSSIAEDTHSRGSVAQGEAADAGRPAPSAGQARSPLQRPGAASFCCSRSSPNRKRRLEDATAKYVGTRAALEAEFKNACADRSQ